MDKARTKYRDIMFRSDKNQEVLCVHSAAAREYAKVLEADSNVVSYEVCVEKQDKRGFKNIKQYRHDFLKKIYSRTIRFKGRVLGYGCK